MEPLAFTPVCFFTRRASSILTEPYSRRTRHGPPQCTAKPASFQPLLDAAREQLQPLGLSVPSLTWQNPVLTVCVSRLNDIMDTEEVTASADVGSDITADDCADASAELTALLDTHDFFSDLNYTLEVSSPGASDSLTTDMEFEAFKGFPVRVEKTEGAKGPVVVRGRLGDVDDDTIFVNMKGRKVKVQRNVVQSVSLCTAAEIGEAGPS